MTQTERMQHCATTLLPADKVNDGFVFEAGVCSAGAPLFVAQLQDAVLKRQRLAHLAAADGRAAFPNAHG